MTWDNHKLNRPQRQRQQVCQVALVFRSHEQLSPTWPLLCLAFLEWCQSADFLAATDANTKQTQCHGRSMRNESICSTNSTAIETYTYVTRYELWAMSYELRRKQFSRTKEWCLLEMRSSRGFNRSTKRTYKACSKEDQQRNGSDNEQVSPTNGRHYKYRHENNEARSNCPEQLPIKHTPT